MELDVLNEDCNVLNMGLAMQCIDDVQLDELSKYKHMEVYGIIPLIQATKSDHPNIFKDENGICWM